MPATAISTRAAVSRLVDPSTGRPFRLGYDAVDSAKKRRRPSTSILRDEDNELSRSQRRDAVSAMRDLVRNFALAKWAINKHLDFVATHTFRSKNNDEDLDRRIEDLMRWWDRPANFDAAGRHGMTDSVRLAEARRIVDGDVFALKLSSGRVQWIEGDRVRTPWSLPAGANVSAQNLTHGVRTDTAGRALSYCVCRRGTGGQVFQFERMIRAANIVHHAWFERFDQVRGISPMVAGFNAFQDVYENVTYALLKSKVAQLFGLVVTRATDDPLGQVTNLADDSDDTAESEAERAGYEIDFGRGPFFQDLDPGDDMKFLENRTPATEFREFMTQVIALALKAIDIPYSFYDESWTNFFGSKAALALYLKSCKEKRRVVQQLLTGLTVWRLALWIFSGVLELPGEMQLRDLKFEWIPGGLPWWDQSKEVAGDVAAIGAGLRTRTEIRKERYGDDWRDVIDGLAEENDYLAQKGVVLAEPAVNVNVGVAPETQEENSKR